MLNIAIIIHFTLLYYAGILLNAFNDSLCSDYAGIIGGSLSPICSCIYFQGMILLYLAVRLLVTPKVFLHDIYAYYTSLNLKSCN